MLVKVKKNKNDGREVGDSYRSFVLRSRRSRSRRYQWFRSRFNIDAKKK
jgi:hypothetical protein